MKPLTRCTIAFALAVLAWPVFATDAMQARLDAIAQRARPATFGIAVLDVQSGKTWQVHADRGYPMMSVFKAPLGAAVLAKVERGELSLAQKITLTRADLRHGRSPIADHFQGDSTTMTLRDLLAAAVNESDNTAADALLRLIGGPAKLTAFLRAHGIEGIRSDRGEGDIYNDVMTPNVQRGVATYMTDPRDTSTPIGAVDFLHKLWLNQLLSKESTQYLLSLMTNARPRRLETGLPKGVTFAHKGGTSDTFDGMTPAFNDIGIARWPDGHAVIVAGFLTGSRAPETERAALFDALGKAVGELGH
ncbi:class A beta-lactamase [Dyella sp. GSA-30]|uniref:class A beta-lactamase n=1 Tax=Dyella sp. GSA-30 TaxID=2994496 RepID=UPI002491787E|nr:class A beta-lactamase [Dyella sp. GSA-30]BDU22262.1 beta-lactamase [Dyella sp. GSA-30]